MRCLGPRLFTFLLCAMLASPLAAQQQGFGAGDQPNGIRWQQDLEAAKAVARQTGRLILVHFWTPGCAPCVTLEQQVFNQPGVAAAIDAQFVPVRLNADENSTIAQGFGITRVPTDVVITPSGEVIGKLISPPTPGAYVAEVSQVASAYNATPGLAFDRATAAVPSPPQINAAYANLSVGANTAPVIAQPVVQPVAPPLASQSPPPAGTASTSVAAPAPSAGVAPLSADNRYVPTPAPAANTSVQAPYAPPNHVASPQVAAAPPSQVANPHMATRPSPSPAGTAQPVAPPMTSVVPVSPVTSATTMQIAQQPPVAAAPAPAGATATNHLPPGAPPLGFDGYCPVSMRNHWRWVPGDPRWGIVHRGRTYWFASQAEQQQFWSDPDRYSPALSGMDPVMAVDHRQQVPGKREHSIDYDNLFYMFCSEATLQQFTANPERYAVGVREAMGIPRGRLVR